MRISHGAYYLDAGRDEAGKRRWIWLSRVSDGEHELYKALAKATRPGGKDLDAVFDRFLGEGMADLAPRTRKDYMAYIGQRLRPVFGEMRPDDVTSSHVAQYLDKRAEAEAGVIANREVACLSSAYNYAMRKGWAASNPCRGVRRNKERPKDRYVRHDEFLAIFEAAGEPLQDFLAVLYLTGLRPGEVMELERKHITPDGIRIEESKTGKVRMIEWSESLRFFVLRASSRAPESPYLLTNSRGRRWGLWAVHSALRRVRAALKAQGVEVDKWSPHSIRAKAESDSREGLGLLPLYRRVRRSKPVW